MGWLLILFIVVPVVELSLLIRLGGAIGLFPTLALIITTGIIGARLAKQQGLSVLHRFQTETQAGRMPGDALIDGAIIVFSGALLLTPGILTDIVGFLGLIPAARSAVKRAIRDSMAKAVARGDVRVETYVVGGRGPGHDAHRPPPGFGHPMHNAQRPRFDRGGPIIDVTPEAGEDDPKTDSSTERK